MKYTDWLIPRLRSLENERRALVNIPERIRMLEMDFGAIRAATTDGDPVSGGTNRREEMLLENIAERDELKRNLAVTRREVRQIEGALDTLSREERAVIEKFYIDRPPDHISRLCEELHIEKAQIYRIKDRAMIHLARQLFGQVTL